MISEVTYGLWQLVRFCRLRQIRNPCFGIQAVMRSQSPPYLPLSAYSRNEHRRRLSPHQPSIYQTCSFPLSFPIERRKRRRCCPRRARHWCLSRYASNCAEGREPGCPRTEYSFGWSLWQRVPTILVRPWLTRTRRGRLCRHLMARRVSLDACSTAHSVTY